MDRYRYYISYKDNVYKKRKITKSQVKAILVRYVLDVYKVIKKLESEGLYSIGVYVFKAEKIERRKRKRKVVKSGKANKGVLF